MLALDYELRSEKSRVNPPGELSTSLITNQGAGCDLETLRLNRIPSGVRTIEDPRTEHLLELLRGGGSAGGYGGGGGSDALTLGALLSLLIVAELDRKLRDKFNFPQNVIRQLQRLFGKVATSVAPLDLPTSICRNPTDIPVLGTALAGGASVLVTVDKYLPALGEFQGIAIIKPGEFLRQTTG